MQMCFVNMAKGLGIGMGERCGLTYVPHFHAYLCAMLSCSSAREKEFGAGQMCLECQDKYLLRVLGKIG